MKYIYLSLLFAASTLQSTLLPLPEGWNKPEFEVLKGRLRQLSEHIATVQGIRNLIPVARKIGASGLSREREEDQIRLILCSSLNSKLQNKNLSARTERTERRLPFAPIEHVDCRLSFFTIKHARCYDEHYTEYTARPIDEALNEFDTCLFTHIKSQENDKRVIESTLAELQ